MPPAERSLKESCADNLAFAFMTRVPNPLGGSLTNPTPPHAPACPPPFKLRPSPILIGGHAQTSAMRAVETIISMLPLPQQIVERPTLVLDIDETLVHSSTTEPTHYDHSFDVFPNPKSPAVKVYVKVRPFVEEFLSAMSRAFEIVYFTASRACYAIPVINLVDPTGKTGNTMLFREHCSTVNFVHVKDLSLLGRKIHRTVIIDNNPAAYVFHPRNAVPISSWFGDKGDQELLMLIPTLLKAAGRETVYEILDALSSRDSITSPLGEFR